MIGSAEKTGLDPTQVRPLVYVAGRCGETLPVLRRLSPAQGKHYQRQVVAAIPACRHDISCPLPFRGGCRYRVYGYAANVWSEHLPYSEEAI